LIKEVALDDAVTQIKTCNSLHGAPIIWVSAYLVDDLLVDSGCNYGKKELSELLKTRQLRAIVNTHHHEDHIAGNKILQSSRRLSIYAHPLAVPLLKRRPKLYSYQELSWGYPDPSEALPIGETIDSRNHELRVIHVPGHSLDHVALIEPKEGWAFVGDSFISIKPISGRLDENQWLIISSLKKIREFSPRILFTAVTDPVKDASRVLDRSIELREEMGRRILKLSNEGLNANHILNEVFGKEAEFDRIGMKTTYKEFTSGQYSTENLVETFIHKQHYFSMNFPEMSIPQEF
jgi:ribonuclease/clavin/mitogillin